MILAHGKMDGLLRLETECLARRSHTGDMKMKLISRGVITLVLILTSAPLIYGQDLSRYRTFSFGMSVDTVSKQADRQIAKAEVIHQRPALIEESTWYPPQPFGSSRPAEPVEKVLFSFYNGELYRMLVTYDSSAIKGMTDEDMIRAVSAKYGVASQPVATINFPTNPSYRATEKVIARWEDSQYSFNLFRSTTSNTFAIVLFDKQKDAQAGVSIAESVQMEKQEAPQREAARVQKENDALEAERQKNIMTLRP
jgi:hypothetical protein